MGKISVSIAGASGYAGGELLRLLLCHPAAEIFQATSEKYAGKLVSRIHPNLRKKTSLRFSSLSELSCCDVLFLSLPHGEAMGKMAYFKKKAGKIVDLSGDFRLNNKDDYKKWYKREHADPGMLHKFVYGIPEIHRAKIKKSSYISSAGCNATATILALYPFFKNELVESRKTVVEVKVGSSEAGNTATPASHHPERSGSVRSYKPTGHRHVAEMLQELGKGNQIQIHFSATSIDMIRGVLATCHLFLKEDMDEKSIWKLFRQTYINEPFIRMVKEREGIYRMPEPKLLIATNYCDIGFEKDPGSNRVVMISAIDNLMKGAAGQAVQSFNIMEGIEETAGLEFPGLHPV